MAFTYNTVGVSGFSGASNGSITATYSNAFTPEQARKELELYNVNQ